MSIVLVKILRRFDREGIVHNSKFKRPSVSGDHCRWDIADQKLHNLIIEIEWKPCVKDVFWLTVLTAVNGSVRTGYVDSANLSAFIDTLNSEIQ